VKNFDPSCLERGSRRFLYDRHYLRYAPQNEKVEIKNRRGKIVWHGNCTLSRRNAVQIKNPNTRGSKTMAIEKKSLISKKAVTTKTTSKATPAVAKLQTAVKLATASKAVTAIRLGKKFTSAKIFS
jgi:hypothetical protein